MAIQTELVLLVLSILFFISIIADKAGYRFGVPALLLFLSVGMIFGNDGLGIQFQNINVAQTIGSVALCIILFSGGLDTKISEVKPVFAQGLILATVGVLFTALFTAVAIWWISGMTQNVGEISFIIALLLAATMSSTDSASVFSILRTKNLKLRNNLRPLLELESGSNDPVAYILVISIMEILRSGGEPNFLAAIGLVFLQLLVGASMGYGLGKLSVKIINRLDIFNQALYPILMLTICLFIFSSTYFLMGNAYLAVYLGGLVLGNSKFVHKRSSLNFMDGMAWLSQLLMFLTLGLLVNPSELIDVIVPGLIISFVMIFITRPLSIFVSLLPFRKMPAKDKMYVSWVGLRGAVPIIFALIPLSEGIPEARYIFNIVFFCTLVSLLLQGTTLSKIAEVLKIGRVSHKQHTVESFDVEFSDEIKSVTREITITKEILAHGNRIMDLSFPERTLIVMVKRHDKFFVPTGKTSLMANDKLLILTDNDEVLKETFVNLGLRKANH